MIERTSNPDYGERLLLKSPQKFSKTPPWIPGPAARLGRHNEEVLQTLCEYSAEQIQGLYDRGVLVRDKKGN